MRRPDAVLRSPCGSTLLEVVFFFLRTLEGYVAEKEVGIELLRVCATIPCSRLLSLSLCYALVRPHKKAFPLMMMDARSI